MAGGERVNGQSRGWLAFPGRDYGARPNQADCLLQTSTEVYLGACLERLSLAFDRRLNILPLYI
jgi:hypothetical protein